MFDLGFSELFVISVVALIVIGPERLPKVARTVGHMFGRMQRYVNDVKSDINREMELKELQTLRDEFENAAKSVQKSVNEVGNEVEKGIYPAEELSNEVNNDLDGLPALPTAASSPGPAEAPKA